MNKMILQLLACFILCLGNFSCSDDNEDLPPDPIDNPDPTPDPDPDPVDNDVYYLSLDAPVVDNSTMEGKILSGYQGWFAHPDDGSPRPHQWHWGNIFEPLKPNVEAFPDYREFCADEKYRSDFTYPDGTMAPIYSANNKRTVMRHVKWMRDYHLDGLLVQRFASELGDGAVKEFRDITTEYIQEGCEKYGRVFSIMYDGVGTNVDVVIDDWKHLVDNKRFTSSGRYLHHEGLPLVTIYGYTFYDGTPDDLARLMDFFENAAETRYRASVMLSLNDNWFNMGEHWLESFRKARAILPWAVGRYHTESAYHANYVPAQYEPGKAWCELNGLMYLPLVFPGFSWSNLYENNNKNEIPRNGGRFMWAQANNYIATGAKSLYLAMFDELDEATCYYKTAENASMAPAQCYWLNLDADGYELPSDWYLRCAAKAKLTLENIIAGSLTLGTPPIGGVSMYPIDGVAEEEKGILFNFPDYPNEVEIQFSVDDGQTFPYTAQTATKSLFVNLPAGTYEVWARHGEGKAKVPMGEVKL